MNKENSNTKLKNFRNSYSVIIGIPCVLFWNFTVFLAEDFWKYFIPAFIILCFYYPLYLLIMLKIYKYDLSNDENFKIENGEKFLFGAVIISFVLTIGSALLAWAGFY